MLACYNEEFNVDYPNCSIPISEFGETELHKLVRGHDMEELEKYLTNNPESVNTCDERYPEKVPPLFSACFKNNKRAAMILVKHGARVNMRCTGVNQQGLKYSMTPLHIAIYCASYEVAVFLTQKGADVDAQVGPSGFTPLHLAVVLGRENIATFLTHQCRVDPNIPSHEDLCCYPILKAVFKGDLRMLLLVLSTDRTNPNVFDANDNLTALHLAVLVQSIDAVRMMISHHANVNPKLKSGHTPLDLSRDKEITDYLNKFGGERKEKKDYIPSFFVLRDSHLHVLKEAWESGSFNINCRFDGISMLHHSIERKQLKVTKFLIDSGADINVSDYSGCTPLHFAAAHDNLVVIHLLLQRAADINARDNIGQTPLHNAAGRGAAAACHLLLERGADSKIISPVAGSALFSAVANVRLSTLELLLAAGLSPHPTITYRVDPKIKFPCKNITGFSALSVACFNNSTDMIRLLIANGANVNALSSTDVGAFYPIYFIPYSNDDVLGAFITMVEAGAYFDIDTIPKLRGRDTVPPNVNILTLEQMITTSGNWEALQVYQSTVKLFHAVRQNDLLAVKECVVQGGLINCCSVTFDTPLIYASYLGSLPIVEFLLNSGAVMYLPSVTRSSPLHYAAKYDRRDVAVSLLKSGARLTYLCEGKTAIELAMSKGHYEMINLLVFVGKYLLASGQKTITPVNKYKSNTIVLKILDELRDKRPSSKLLRALFADNPPH